MVSTWEVMDREQNLAGLSNDTEQRKSFVDV